MDDPRIFQIQALDELLDEKNSLLGRSRWADRITERDYRKTLEEDIARAEGQRANIQSIMEQEAQEMQQTKDQEHTAAVEFENEIDI